MHVCKSHTLYAYYNANNGFENYHFDRTMETLTVIAQKFLNTRINASRFVYISKKKKKKKIHTRN